MPREVIGITQKEFPRSQSFPALNGAINCRGGDSQAIQPADNSICHRPAGARVKRV
jgi:hypothetical protein